MPEKIMVLPRYDVEPSRDRLRTHVIIDNWCGGRPLGMSGTEADANRIMYALNLAQRMVPVTDGLITAWNELSKLMPTFNGEKECTEKFQRALGRLQCAVKDATEGTPETKKETK